MTGCDHCNCRLRSGVVYITLALMFFMILSHLFISIYSLHSSSRLMTPPDVETPYFRNANKQEWETFRPVVKREIPTEKETNCEDRQSKSSDDNRDAIQLTGSWHIKKSDLREYCFSAEDFCRRNGSGIKKNDDEEEKEEIEEIPKNDCFVSKVDDRVPMSIPPSYEMYEHWFVDPFQDPPEGEFSIWVKRFRELLEYRISRNLTYMHVRKNYTLLHDDLAVFSGIVYNGSYFYQYKWEKKIVKLNLTTTEVIKEKELEELENGFGFGGYICFYSDEYGLWAVYNGLAKNQIVWFHINPETLNILSIREATNIRYASVSVFAAFGKLYNTEIFRFEEEGTVYSLVDFFHRDEKNVSLKFNLTGLMNKVLYDWRRRHLYVDEYGGYFRYKVHFRCLEEST